ncbi:hypothetical protein BDW62DRAFT_148113 [Aspergillus aurantiobrunneus]
MTGLVLLVTYLGTGSSRTNFPVILLSRGRKGRNWRSGSGEVEVFKITGIYSPCHLKQCIQTINGPVKGGKEFGFPDVRAWRGPTTGSTQL